MINKRGEFVNQRGCGIWLFLVLSAPAATAGAQPPDADAVTRTAPDIEEVLVWGRALDQLGEAISAS